MPQDMHFHRLRYELRGGPLNGARYDHSLNPRSDDPESGVPYFDSMTWPTTGKKSKTHGHRYDLTDEYSPDNFRFYRYAGVVPLPSVPADRS